MAGDLPSLSTDQVAAFVELARQGNIRRAAEVLHITEQAVRNRLIVLEHRLGVELYRKSQGIRRATPLTLHGQQFLPHAIAFLERARQLTGLFNDPEVQSEIHVVASQYLVLYVLVDAVRRFHHAHPHIRIRLSSRTAQEIERDLLRNAELAFGVATPFEPSSKLEYRHLFSMGWSLIAPLRHPLLRKSKVRLHDLTDVPLILFERGSTGRKQVLDAFHGRGLSPRIEMEMTNTEIIVRMVEAGLGVSIIPVTGGGAVTRGHRIGVRPLNVSITNIVSIF